MSSCPTGRCTTGTMRLFRSVAFWSSSRQYSELTESGLIRNTNACEPATPSSRSRWKRLAGGTSSQSAHTSFLLAARASWIRRAISRSWCECERNASATAAEYVSGLGRRQSRRGSALDPDPQLLVHVGVAQQVEVVEAAEVTAVVQLEWDPAPPPLPRGARVLHEQVAHDLAEAVVGVAGQRGPDEVVGRGGQERDVVVSLRAVAEAEVLNAGTAGIHEAGEGPGLAQPVERPARRVGGLGKRRAQVRRAQAEHVPHPLGPAVAVVAGAPNHEPSHGVPDQGDLLHVNRPLRLHPLEQLGQPAAVV